MTYCLNPACQHPANPGDGIFCIHCGANLRLGDRYRALQQIGQGGFGRTFLAVDAARLPAGDQPDLDLLADPTRSYPPSALCVIKQFLPMGRRDSPKALELFRQEAERLALLGQHPQIPQLLAHFEQDDGQYLVQEFVNGKNLNELLAEQGPFTESQVRMVLNSLLPVLSFIHSERVIHRDIKPENIIRRSPLPLPDESDDPPPTTELVLVDFGASKYATTSALARTGTLIGSAGYAAPEQVMGKADFASDLYSLGITCIHLLTGLHPFELYSASEDTWIWKQYLPKPVSDRLTQILNKMLQRATSQRYRSANEILEDLNLRASAVVRLSRPEPLAVAGAPVMLRPPGSSERLPLELSPDRRWECIRTLSGHAGIITCVAVSADGLFLASGSSDKTVKLWSLETGDLLHSFEPKSLRFRQGHSDRISALTFSPDGLELISGSEDCTIKQWDVSTRKLIRTIPSHGWLVSAIATSQNVPFLASGGGDGRVNLWDLTTGEAIASLVKHRDQVSAILLSPDSQTLISASYDRTIRLWDLRTDRLINTLRGHTDRISAIAITPDWLTLISTGWDNTLRFWDLSRGEQVRSILAHKAPITCLALDPTGRLLASGSEDNFIRLWQLTSNERGIALPAPRPLTLPASWSVTDLTFSPNGETLVSSSADETIRIWISG